MATIVLRSVKGSPLSNDEVDANFSNLNSSKLEINATAASATAALNISGGVAGSIPYQTAPDATTLLAPGTAGYVLTSNGSGAPSWSKATAGATGGGEDKIFWENDKIVTGNYTISSSKNAGTFGPIAINSGVTITVSSGSVWTIV